MGTTVWRNLSAALGSIAFIAQSPRWEMARFIERARAEAFDDGRRGSTKQRLAGGMEEVPESN